MNSFENLSSCPWDEVIENKVLLRKLNPDAKSLEYISICEVDGSVIVDFNFKYLRPELRKGFEKYTGLSLKDNPYEARMLRAYNEALKMEIEENIRVKLERDKLS